MQNKQIIVKNAHEHNLKNIDINIPRNKITVITGVSGSGKSSLAFDTIFVESQRRFYYTLSHYSRQFLDMGNKPKVAAISGLSPAISLSQNESPPSKKATVGSLSELTELIGVYFARFGIQYCPQHDLKTSNQSINDIVTSIFIEKRSKKIAIMFPIAIQKKGNFKVQLEKVRKKGFVKALINGDMIDLDVIPVLSKSKKHDIFVFVDMMTCSDSSRKKLTRALDACMADESQLAYVFEVQTAKGQKSYSYMKLKTFSTRSGCSKCGFSWPKLDSRYFNCNSLGSCSSCSGRGNTPNTYKTSDGEEVVEYEICDECLGTGIRAEAGHIKVSGRAIQEIHSMSMDGLADFFQRQKKVVEANPAKERVLDSIDGVLVRLIKSGLNYLSLSRRIYTLSGGENQRLRLANILGEQLHGVLYVLDEPSQGLHPSELDDLWDILEKIRDGGNTLIIIDHDDRLMKKADLIVDLGPNGGRYGGEIMSVFEPKNARFNSNTSLTAKYLSGQKSSPKTKKAITDKLNAKQNEKKTQQTIKIKNASIHNLKIEDVSFQKSSLNVVCGVSGAGKSSLVIDTLYQNLILKKMSQKSKWQNCSSISGSQDFKYIHLIDRRPLAKNSISMPISYLGAMVEVRNLFASLPQSQLMGLTARDFSINVKGGRCENCRGRGKVALTMRFLADAKVQCDSCLGSRFLPHIQSLTYNGHSMNQVLELTIQEGYELFKNHPRISKRFKPALEIGLGYLKLGQPSSSLSGGEAQRIKLMPFINKKQGDQTLIIIDEPTTGLHFSDVERFLEVIQSLKDLGSTIVLIEHNSHVIEQADWIVEVGPGSASNGGQLVFQGPFTAFSKAKTKTSKYL